MKTRKLYSLVSVALLALASCSKDDNNPVANDMTLHFNNTFKNTTIVLGDAASSAATINTSADGQVHHFAELKYVISNIDRTSTRLNSSHYCAARMPSSS